ncbi:hypothetical protein LCGC14_2450600 [marine sediment metagenome]|uniref:Uncharacterized protein n=1 Tax=marine sediment metagenome TaxID=412755 RepID=A0A0F9BGA2_9ZZZZ
MKLIKMKVQRLLMKFYDKGLTKDEVVEYDRLIRLIAGRKQDAS